MAAPAVGLCATCVHARRVETDRGSVFVRCALAEKDPRFPKYPRLPVRRCEGHKPARQQDGSESDAE